MPRTKNTPSTSIERLRAQLKLAKALQKKRSPVPRADEQLEPTPRKPHRIGHTARHMQRQKAHYHAKFVTLKPHAIAIKPATAHTAVSDGLGAERHAMGFGAETIAVPLVTAVFENVRSRILPEAARLQAPKFPTEEKAREWSSHSHLSAESLEAAVQAWCKLRDGDSGANTYENVYLPLKRAMLTDNPAWREEQDKRRADQDKGRERAIIRADLAALEARDEADLDRKELAQRNAYRALVAQWAETLREQRSGWNDPVARRHVIRTKEMPIVLARIERLKADAGEPKSIAYVEAKLKASREVLDAATALVRDRHADVKAAAGKEERKAAEAVLSKAVADRNRLRATHAALEIRRDTRRKQLAKTEKTQADLVAVLRAEADEIEQEEEEAEASASASDSEMKD